MDVLTSKQVATLINNIVNKETRRLAIELTSFLEAQIRELSLRVTKLEQQSKTSTSIDDIL